MSIYDVHSVTACVRVTIIYTRNTLQFQLHRFLIKYYIMHCTADGTDTISDEFHAGVGRGDTKNTNVMNYICMYMLMDKWFIRGMRSLDINENIYRSFQKRRPRIRRILLQGSSGFCTTFRRALKSRLALPLCPPYPGGRQTAYNWDGTSAAMFFGANSFSFYIFYFFFSFSFHFFFCFVLFNHPDRCITTMLSVIYARKI